MRALRVTHMALVVAFVPRLGFLIRTLLIMTKRAATPASVLLAWSFFMAVLGTQVMHPWQYQLNTRPSMIVRQGWIVVTLAPLSLRARVLWLCSGTWECTTCAP